MRTLKTTKDFARAICESSDTYALDGDFVAFDARQDALWGAVAKRSRRFRIMVTDAIREMP